MDNKTICTILLIASAGLFVAGMIYLLLAIFYENESSWEFLTCIVLANIFNLIRISLNKKKKDTNEEK